MRDFAPDIGNDHADVLDPIRLHRCAAAVLQLFHRLHYGGSCFLIHMPGFVDNMGNRGDGYSRPVRHIFHRKAFCTHTGDRLTRG